MILCQSLLQTTTGEMNDLFPTGKLQEPLITAVANSQLALGKHCLDVQGIPCSFLRNVFACI